MHYEIVFILMKWSEMHDIFLYVNLMMRIKFESSALFCLIRPMGHIAHQRNLNKAMIIWAAWFKVVVISLSFEQNWISFIPSPKDALFENSSVVLEKKIFEGHCQMFFCYFPIISPRERQWHSICKFETLTKDVLYQCWLILEKKMKKWKVYRQMTELSA